MNRVQGIDGAQRDVGQGGKQSSDVGSRRASWFTEADHAWADKCDRRRVARMNRPKWFTPKDHAWADQCDKHREQEGEDIRIKVESILRNNIAIDATNTKIEFGKPGYRFTDLNAHAEYMKNGGWKLHITVNPENYSAVDRWLFLNHRGQFKLLTGGELGKTFTIYVGSRKNAQALSEKMMREIGLLLEKNEAGRDDMIIFGEVAGRFDIQMSRKGRELGFETSNCGEGIPYDGIVGRKSREIDLRYLRDKTNPQRAVEYRRLFVNEKSRIIKLLRREYGEYFGL